MSNNKPVADGGAVSEGSASSPSSEAMRLKASGNELVAAGRFEEARSVFTKSIDLLRSSAGSDKALISQLLSNRALCEAKLEDFAACEASCTQSLELDPSNLKALYRRSKARLALQKLEDAVKDAKTLLKLSPQSSAAVDLMKELATVAKNQEQGMRKLVQDACAPKASRDVLKQLLGALHDDEGGSRALEAASRGGLELLLAHARTVDPLAYSVVAKIAAHSPQKVAAALDENQCLNRKALVELIKDPKADELRSAAGLTIVLRCDLVNPKGSVDADLYLAALKDPREGVQNVAVEACAQIFGVTPERAQIFCDKGGIETLASVTATSPQLVSVLLGRVLSKITMGGDDKTKDDAIVAHCETLCKDAFETFGYVQESSESLEKRRLGLLALLSVFQANAELGLEIAVKSDRHRAALGEAALQAPDSTVRVAAEILAQMANTEKGRAALQADENFVKALRVLVNHTDRSVRASASVALTKVQAVHFDVESEQGAKVMDILVSLLAKEATPEEVDRGLEAVSFVVQDTDVKMMMTVGPEGERIIGEFCRIARDVLKEEDPSVEKGKKTAAADEANPPTRKRLSNDAAYAIAYILANLSMDQDDVKREKLREMEVSQEQWEQFEQITKQKSGSGNSRKDSPEEVELRVDAIVEAGGVAALRALMLKRGSVNVSTQCAKALLNLARAPRVRGQMLAQGALGALIKAHQVLHKELPADVSSHARKSAVGVRYAAHAMALLLITTDPKLLSNAHMQDVIQPLLEQIRHCDEDLVVFECLMALTNLETMGDEVKRRVCQLKGLHAIEYAQFSEEMMVRRSATEAMANLFPCDELIEWLAKGDKVRLFLLLAEDVDGGDLATARAASGLLAGAFSEPRIVHAARRFGGLERLALLITETGSGEVVHRLLVALANALDSEDIDPEVAKADELFTDSSMVSPSDQPAAGPVTWQARRGPFAPEEKKAIRDAFVLASKETSNAAAVKRDDKWAPAVSFAKVWLSENPATNNNAA